MQYIKIDDWFKVVRVSGPQHNVLGIKFGMDAILAPDVIVHAIDVEYRSRRCLESGDVLMSVLDGVAEANANLETALVVHQVEFVTSDSPPVTIYRFLARSIVERVAKCGQNFKVYDGVENAGLRMID